MTKSKRPFQPAARLRVSKTGHSAASSRVGFTLVEMLLVITIIAILAAAVIPLIAGDSKTSAAESALRINLSNIRLAIQYYVFQHRGKFPGELHDGSFEARTEECFKRQLTLPTSSRGQIVPAGSQDAKGPYLLELVPECPLGELRGGRSVSVVDEPNSLEPDGSPSHPWKYNVRTGEFICNSNETAKSGTPYWQW